MTFQGVTLDLEGESGPVRVRIRHMPVIARAAGDGYRYASPEFGSELLEAVIAGTQQANQTGLPWSRVARCAACALPLDPPVSDSDFVVPIRLPGLPQFDAEFRMPTLTCGHCGTVQMPPSRELDFHRTEALLQAFKAAHIDPS